MNDDLMLALDELQETKGISKQAILKAVATALEKSYQKNYSEETNVEVTVDPDSGEFRVFQVKEVVENPEDTIAQISLAEARTMRAKVDLGDKVRIEVKPKNFGRVAAQTARNVVIQQLRDAEREAVYDAYKDRMREIIVGTVQRTDRNNVYINLGTTEGVVPRKEQMPTEHLAVGDRVKLYVSDVRVSTRGPQVLLSRADKNLVARLFEQEVPEISEGVVEIYSVSREAGSRSKIAVYSHVPNVDPIGACVGYKGNRVNLIVDELNGEKMDIVIYNEDPRTFIANALSPSEVFRVILNEEEKSALVVVPDDQLSLAIGKEGQNVRLAARLTGWKIDIKGKSVYDANPEQYEAMAQEKSEPEQEETIDLFSLPEEAADAPAEDSLSEAESAEEVAEDAAEPIASEEADA